MFVLLEITSGQSFSKIKQYLTQKEAMDAESIPKS